MIKIINQTKILHNKVKVKENNIIKSITKSKKLSEIIPNKINKINIPFNNTALYKQDKLKNFIKIIKFFNLPLNFDKKNL
jgi:hypothetical protein